MIQVSWISANDVFAEDACVVFRTVIVESTISSHKPKRWTKVRSISDLQAVLRMRARNLPDAQRNRWISENDLRRDAANEMEKLKAHLLLKCLPDVSYFISHAPYLHHNRPYLNRVLV